MRRKLLTLSLFLIATAGAVTASAQDYKKAIGLTLGGTTGINYKHFITERSAIEAQVGYNFSHRAPLVSAVYQYHVPVVDNLKFYFGGGVNLGAAHVGYKGHDEGGEFVIGLDPTVGFEYKFNNAPIALALDYKPSINFTTHPFWNEAALKVRFAF